MFYSQFILAKQGPLGTIWIAAHSTNATKLRKSQIADTDLPGSCGARRGAFWRFGALRALRTRAPARAAR
jgi:hypothetical protein